MENKMIKNLEERTGVTLEEWIKRTRGFKEEKHKAIIDRLKSEFNLTYGFANLIAHKTRKSDAGSHDDDSLIIAQYSGKENLKPLYESIITAVKKFGDDIELAPKKAYVSLRRKKQFGLIQPSTKTRMDIGLKIPDQSPVDRLEAAGSWNTMVTHRIKIADTDTVDQKLIDWLKTAYQNAG